MAGGETVFQGIVELNLVDNAGPGLVTAIDQLQTQMNRINAMTGVNMSAGVEGLTAALGSAAAAAEYLQRRIEQLSIAQLQLAGGSGTSMQLAFVEATIVGYDALIAKVLEYQALASRPVWAIPPAERAGAYAQEFPAIVGSRAPAAITSEEQVAAQQAAAQRAVAASPFYTATPVGESPADVQRRLGVAADRQIAAQSQYTAALEAQVAGLIPHQRAIAMGPAAPPSGPTGAWPPVPAAGLYSTNPASETFLAEQLTAEQDQIAALKATSQAEWKLSEGVRTQAATQEQLTRMQAESAHRQAMTGTPQEVQAALVDPNISAAAKAQALKVQVLQIQNEQSQLNLAAGYKVLDAETTQGATDERTAKLKADIATLEQRRIVAVERLLAGEERLVNLTDEEASGGGGSGSSGTAHGRHGYGTSDPLAQGLMVAKYMLLYQAFSVVQQGIGTLMKATEDYSLAVNQLSIALGVNNTEAAATAQTYATVGQSLATPPAVAVTAATQYTRFFQDTSGAAGNIGAQLGSTINLLEGKSFQQGQEEAMITKAMDELGAIAQNYGLGASGAQDLYSAATVIAQHYGQGGGSAITQGTAQIADLLKQAGFSPEQGLALVGQVSQATGTTGEMAAGDLKRLLGRTGSNTFQSLFGEYGINPNQSTSKELGQLSLKFQDLTPTQQDTIITKLGGGRAGAAALATIVNFQDIIAEGNKAKANPQAAEQQAQLKLATFGGQMESIRTDLLAFATDLGQAGLGTILGLILKSVDPLIRGLDDLIKGFNALGPVVDNGALFLGTLALAVKLLGGSLDKAGLEAAAGKVTGALGGTRGQFSAGGWLGGLATPVKAAPLSEAETLVAKTSVDATAALRTEAAAQLAFAEANDKAAASLILATDGTKAQKDASVADALAETSAKEKLALASREVTATTVLQGEATKGLIAGQQEAAVATTMTEAETAAGGLGVAMTGLAATAGAAALAIAPLVAIILAVMAASAVKTTLDTQGAGRAEGTSANTAGTNAMKTGNIPLAQSAANLDMAGASKVLNANTGFWGTFLSGVGIIKDVVSGQDWQSTAKAQVAAIQSMIDEHKKLTDWITAATAAQNKMNAATPSSALFGPGYANINTGVTTMAAQQMSVPASSQKLRDLIANTPAGTIGGDVNIGAMLTPASGDKGVAVEVAREITLAKKALSPLTMLSDLKSLLPVAAELTAMAAKVGDPAQRAADLEAAQAISDSISGAYYPALLKLTTDKIDSIKALSSNQGQNLTQIKALLTSSITEAAQGGDTNTVVALFALGDKAFMDRTIAESQARLTVIDNSVKTDIAADKAAVIVATAAANAAIIKAGDPSRPGMQAPASFDPAQQAIIDKKKKSIQSQVDAFNVEEAANRARDATLRSFQVNPSGPDTNAEWLLTVQTNIETQKAILFKQLSAIDQSNIDLANEQAILGGMVSKPSTATAGPAGAAADFGAAAPNAAVDASKDPKVIAAEKKLAADQASLAIQLQILNTETGAASISAPTGSAFQPGKAAADAYATQEAMLAAQAISGDPISQASAALAVAEFKMTESTSVGAVYWQNLKGLHDAQYALAQAQEAGANAQVQASVIPGDPISAATVALQVAQNQLANAVGSTAYYTALKGVHDAQYALAQAQLADANNIDLLNIDMTNPLLMAQEKVREAARTLSMDQNRGVGQNVINNDMVALRNATSAAQKTAFDQQFSDEQTNYQLQRTSLSAYLSYLNAQHLYLTSVKNKTRQQVDELNQVDQALKGLADQMQGQFNLGQIKVPTVYEARGGGGSVTTQNVQITITGTDIPAVKAILTQYVGQAAMATAGSAARKV
jgi:hypothetical protein